ncbi:MAG: DEAD/DEAH box helicase [Cetobacterium sp.]
MKTNKTKMSVKINLNQLIDEDKKFIEETLSVSNKKNDIVQFFDVGSDKSVYLPFNFAYKHFELKKKTINHDDSKNVFVGELRPAQIDVSKKCKDILCREGCVILAAQPGFGKTITAIEMLCWANLKTVIFVKQKMIGLQWVEALKIHAPTKNVQHVKNKKIDHDADVYIVNPILLKHSQRALGFDFKDVQLLIVDELHQIVSGVLSKAFFKVQPSYLVGLSATPRRPKDDPFQNAIDWFFGDNIVGNALYHRHEVCILRSDFTPNDIKYNGFKVDWNHILTTQSEDKKRNELIVNTVASRQERVWLILVKRVAHAETLQRMFTEKGILCETLTGSKSVFDRGCKILIGTTSKIGVGFDHSPINALFVAADVVEYFEQFLGRCMRIPDQIPIVYDIEDSFSILKNHAKIRLTSYLKHGGKLI